MPDTFLADFLVGVDFKPTLTRSVIFFISDKICAIIVQALFLLFLQQLFQQGDFSFSTASMRSKRSVVCLFNSIILSRGLLIVL